MSDTPARDALRKRLYVEAGAPVPVARYDVDRVLAGTLANPDLMLAALIESGWRPTDDDLRAMGGIPTTMVRTVAGTLPLREPALWQFPKEANDG